MFRLTRPVSRISGVMKPHLPRAIPRVQMSLNAIGEPPKPNVVTEVPGPRSTEYLSRLSKFQDVRTALVVPDIGASRGNYLTDIDGNTFLDFHGQIASMAIGYNNLTFEENIDYDTLLDLCNRPALGVFPPDYLLPAVEKIMTKAPIGLNKIFLSMSGSDANEIAFKLAFMKYRRDQRYGADFSDEEVESVMLNKAPGSPNLSVLSVTGGFHGRLLGSLSVTRSKPIHKLDIPAFDWPVAPFPRLKYPLDDSENIVVNRLEEQCCIQIVEEIIKTNETPVAALIVEPVQAEGGDNHATPYFFQGLRTITKKYGVTFIVDEVQTGVGGTGRFWAHEAWGLTDPPDIVTFAKKMQAAGLFYSDSYVPSHPFRNFNTWMGNPLDIVKAGVIIDFIDNNRLIHKVESTGKIVVEELQEFKHIHNVRGSGAFIAFDVENQEVRDNLIIQMRNKGVLINGCGEKTIRIRPMLVYNQEHAYQFLSALDDVLKDL